MAEGQPTFHIIDIRHGQAHQGNSDIDRTLSPTGRLQGEELKRRFTHEQLKRIRWVFTSPAKRCTQLAEIVLQGYQVAIESLEALMPFKGPMDEIFRDYGYEMGLYGQDPRHHALQIMYGQSALYATVGMMRGRGWNPKPGEIVINFGHAVTANYKALAASTNLWGEKRLPTFSILTHKLEEGGGIQSQFTLDGKFVDYKVFSQAAA